MDEWDRIERLTHAVGRCVAVFLPVWIVLLGVLPFATGLGPLACLSLATLVAVAAVVVVERRRARRRAAPSGEAARERRPMSAPAAVALTLGVVVLLVYILFVIRAG
jgi:hypothetical protein